MVYSEKFAAAVVINGKIARDVKDGSSSLVRLPIGSEYSLRFKNLNATRVSVSVSIDGEDVLDGSKLVVNPNDSIDLEGFMKNNTAKNKFKFIKKTQEISDHRGDRIDDGLIRIEYQFVNPRPVVIDTYEHHHYNHWDYWDYWWYPTHPWYKPWPMRGGIIGSDIKYGSSIGGSSSSLGPDNSADTFKSLNSKIYGSVQNQSINAPDELRATSQVSSPDIDGITVHGSQINQGFNTTYLGVMEEATHSIIIQLVGTTSKNEPIKKAVLVEQKITCSVCGRRQTSNNKYCGGCGNCLI